MRAIQLFVKRVFDFVLALILAILTVPVFLVIAIAISIESPGSPIFKQERLGKNGRTFTVYKFRTMVKDAEKMGTGIFTSETDERITRVGSFLRKTSLDELPQIYNILKGEMSFIGPRPPVPYHPRKYEDYSPEQKLRFTMLPGITGYAQVMGRNSLSWDERIKLDVEYVKNYSLWLDIKILLMTFGAVALSKNIYKGSGKDAGAGYKA